MCEKCESKVSVVSDEKFVNLHLHTAYSLLDGMSRVDDVVTKVKSYHQKGFAVTEHGNVHSSVKAYKAAKEAGLKFIYGEEFYITEDRFLKDKTKKYYHLTVLAMNEQGRQNINKLTTIASLTGFYHKPRIDHKLLSEHKEGLVVMSGCMASELQQALAGGKIGNGNIEITSGNIERAKEIVRWYHDTFGENYYLEVQSHRDARQQQLNRAIVDIALDMGIEWVATADSHFVNEDDLDLHRIFIAIARNKDEYETDETYQDTHIQSEREAWTKLESLTAFERDVAIRNTMIILDKCNVELPLSAALIPKVEVPKVFSDQKEYLKHLCNEGWKMRKINKKGKQKAKEYRGRLMYEYNAITEMGFEGYYLLVYGYANSVQRRGIARGSGGGSLVAYLLNIVDIDPIEHGLYFERFIDVAQLDLLREGKIKREELKIPDFDLDFGTKERDLVVENIVEEHGQERVAALGQFGYIWSKSAIKDVGRVMGIPFEETNAITKALDDDTIEGAIISNNHEIIAYERKYPQLFEYARKLEGLPRSYGKHPCGKVITIDEAVYYTALDLKEGEMTIHVDMKDAEALGLVKVDLLGLRTVDVIYDTLDMIGKDTEYIRNLDYSEENVLKIFKDGFTDGIFQFESDGMKKTMKNMQPTGIDDLSAVNALYRPGAMKYIDNYIARMHGLEDFKYLHHDLADILGVTYGIIVFQEQLIQIGRLAGMRNPDLLRQATGKKDIKKLKKAEPELRKGLYARGWTQEQVDQLWADMLDFARYSFNKAHSQAYAIIAFICAFLKKNHPLEFMCAWLNSLESHHDKLDTAYKEAKRMGIQFSTPKYGNTLPLCKVENDKITYGLSLIKHCNRQMAEDLMMVSKKNHKYFVDVLIDIKENSSVNSKQLDILLKLDTFKQFGHQVKLMHLVNEFNEGKNRYNKTHKDATKEKRKALLHEYEDELNKLDYGSIRLLNPIQTILFEQDHYGFIMSKFPEMNGRVVGILNVDLKYTPKITCYIFKTGEVVEFKCKRDKFFGKKDIEPFEIGDMIKILKISNRNRVKKVDDQWVETGEIDYYLEKCSKVKIDK